MAKATEKPTTRRAVLTGAATLALIAKAANANAAPQKAVISLQPSEHGLALLRSLPALGKAAYLDSTKMDIEADAEYDAAECDRIERLYVETWATANQLVNAILDSSQPNLIDLGIVAKFNADTNQYEADGEVASRLLADALLELAGIDSDLCTVCAHYDAYAHSIGAKA